MTPDQFESVLDVTWILLTRFLKRSQKFAKYL